MYQRFDYQYIRCCREILDSGSFVKGRGGLEYFQVFGQDLIVDLREEFPILTLRKMPLKNILREFIWDIQGNSNVNDLGKAKHFWDFLSDDNGYLPGSYGSSWRSWPVSQPRDSYEYKTQVFRDKPYDQLAFIRKELIHNPTNRQLVLTTLNPSHNPQRAICPPCHPTVVFSSNGVFLDTLVLARSNDMATGTQIDMIRYSLLTLALARDAILIPRYIKFSSANNHIYLQNKTDVEKMISREPIENSYPKIEIKARSLFDIKTIEDIEISNYQSHEAIKFHVAV